MPSVATIGLSRMRPIRNPFSRAGGDGGEERDGDRRPEPRVVAGRVLGQDHDVERQPAGNREVDAALHDDERLAQRRDRERRGERQHRQERAPGDARRREHETRREQRDRRHEDGDEAARQEASATPAGRRPSTPSRPVTLRCRASRRSADANARATRSQVTDQHSVRLRDPSSEHSAASRPGYARLSLYDRRFRATRRAVQRDADSHELVFVIDEHCTNCDAHRTT